ATDSQARADFAEARALLDQADKASGASHFKRAIDMQRAEIAWAEGDLVAARAFAELAVARRGLGSFARMQAAGALALRGLVHAARGELESARIDVELVRRHPLVFPQALSRAELAEAIALARLGDRFALARHMEKNRHVCSKPRRANASSRAY